MCLWCEGGVAWQWLQTGGGADQSGKQTQLWEVSLMRTQDVNTAGKLRSLSYSEVVSCFSCSVVVEYINEAHLYVFVEPTFLQQY